MLCICSFKFLHISTLYLFYVCVCICVCVCVCVRHEIKIVQRFALKTGSSELCYPSTKSFTKVILFLKPFCFGCHDLTNQNSTVIRFFFVNLRNTFFAKGHPLVLMLKLWFIIRSTLILNCDYHGLLSSNIFNLFEDTFKICLHVYLMDFSQNNFKEGFLNGQQFHHFINVLSCILFIETQYPSSVPYYLVVQHTYKL